MREERGEGEEEMGRRRGEGEERREEKGRQFTIMSCFSHLSGTMLTILSQTSKLLRKAFPAFSRTSFSSPSPSPSDCIK